jgi:hypothetical protein
VSLRVVGKDTIILLDEGTAVGVRQQKQDGAIALVANLDDTLEVVQLGRGGGVPRTMKLIGRDRAEFNIISGSGDSTVIIFDEDGDGLPDTKIEAGKKFRRKQIEWTEVQKKR